MKKLLVCLCLLVSLFLHIPTNTTKALNFEGDYTFYTTAKFEGEGCKSLQNGNLWQVSCDSEVADKIKPQLTNLVGESITFVGEDKTFRLVCDSLGKSLFTSEVDGILVVEGFGSSLDKYVVKQGKKINFQVAFDGSRITVGTPTIFGSF